jgi:predicted Zn-dependent protease
LLQAPAKIVRNSDAQVSFTIKVIDSEAINAFALPGGFFHATSGEILALDEEGELAGVMAHEIGNVAACHAANFLSSRCISLEVLHFVSWRRGCGNDRNSRT